MVQDPPKRIQFGDLRDTANSQGMLITTAVCAVVHQIYDRQLKKDVKKVLICAAFVKIWDFQTVVA